MLEYLPFELGRLYRRLDQPGEVSEHNIVDGGTANGTNFGPWAAPYGIRLTGRDVVARTNVQLTRENRVADLEKKGTIQAAGRANIRTARRHCPS